MKGSSKPRAVLDQYRARLSPLETTRARVWDGLAERAAAGELPSLATPPEPPTLPALQPALGWSPALVAGALGAGAVLIIAAAWSWRDQPARVAPHARAPAVASAPSSTSGVDEPRSRPQQAVPDDGAPPPRTGGGSLAAAGKPDVAPRVAAVARVVEPVQMGGSAGRDGGASPSSPARAPRTAPGKTHASFAAGSSGSGSRRVALEHDASPNSGRPAPQLEEELRLLRGAYEALRSDRPEAALTWLDEHATHFPGGALAEPREVARIMALCQAGRRQAARIAADRFLQRAPRSPHAGRVRALCVDSGEPQ